VEVTSFFTFTLALGGTAPGVTGSLGSFLVLEEEFIDLPSAASAACTHQFNNCVVQAGSAFSGTGCLSQINSCQGVANTAVPVASTPGSVTATATVLATASSGVSAPEVTGGGVQDAGLGGSGACTVETVTVTSLVSSGIAVPSVGLLHLRRHAKARALGDY
jgi:hypothetical protein